MNSVSADRETHGEAFDEGVAQARRAAAMIRRPFPTEWDTSALDQSRRAYLEDGVSFEKIVASMLGDARVIGAEVRPYARPAPGEKPKNARQVVFLVGISREICDLLYNAPDGLRGRYWQSPDHGFAATRQLIGELQQTLMAFVDALFEPS